MPSPRSGVEVMAEVQPAQGRNADLAIRRHTPPLLPVADVLLVLKEMQGRTSLRACGRRHVAMIDDGSYDRIFEKYFREDILRLQLGSGERSSLLNPGLPPSTPLTDSGSGLFRRLRPRCCAGIGKE